MNEESVLKFSIRQTIARSPSEVFQAFVDPDKLSGYFTTSASGPLVAGTSVEWRWGDEMSLTHIEEVQTDECVVCTWRAYQVDYDTRCTFRFAAAGDGATTVTITEEGWRNDAAGRISSYEHCSGWTHMLMCMKARLEHDLDLR